MTAPTSAPADPAGIRPPPGHPLGGARAALMLMTRLPVGSAPLSAAAQRWGAAFFPLAGLVVGGAGAAVFAIAGPALGDLVAAVLAVLATCLLTGALHEDGLADSADALGGGGRDVDRVLAILKDSRHGTFGVLALGFSLLLRVGVLERLAALASIALVLAAVVARTAVVGLMWALPYVTPPAQARSGAAARAGAGPAAGALLLGLFIAAAVALAGIAADGGGSQLPVWLLESVAFLSVVSVLASLATVAVTTAAAGWYFRRRTGGMTGDFLGAAIAVNEIAVLLLLAILEA